MNPPQNHSFIHKTPFHPHTPTAHFSILLHNHVSSQKTPPFLKFPAYHFLRPPRNQVPIAKTAPFHRILASRLLFSLQDHLSSLLHAPLLKNYVGLHVQLSLLAALSLPLPSFAAETEQVSDKINIETILVSIDDFFNRNPFFVAGVTFIWLVVIPLTQEYLRKWKYISAVDAFQKLRDDPNSQLLDIRKEQSLRYLSSPNLKILKKNAVQVEFSEGQEEGFVKEVLKTFRDPANTILCVLDNFDGDSLKVAELLFKNGFKEAYAIRGGVRGKNGWQATQEMLLPPSVHVYPKKSKKSAQVEEGTDIINEQKVGGGHAQASAGVPQHAENGYLKPTGAAPEAKPDSQRPLSPYPNYPDLKPPSSPTPSKPQL